MNDRTPPAARSSGTASQSTLVRVALMVVNSLWLAACATLVPVPVPLPAPVPVPVLDPADRSAAPGRSIPSDAPNDKTTVNAYGELTAARAAWARVLDRFVNEAGEVDFSALAADRADLDRWVAQVATLDPSAFASDAERLAHHINAYNALSMYNVITAGIPATHAGLARIDFFVLRKLLNAHERRSLRSYENDIIRPLDEPRAIHLLRLDSGQQPAGLRRRLCSEVQRDASDREVLLHQRRFVPIDKARGDATGTKRR